MNILLAALFVLPQAFNTAQTGADAVTDALRVAAGAGCNAKPTPPVPLGAKVLSRADDVPVRPADARPVSGWQGVGEKLLPVRFVAGGTARRVAYDFPIRLNLATNATLLLDVAVSDLRITALTLYLKSGNGWFSGVRKLTEASVGHWTRLELSRADFGWIEGRPAGWAHIDGMRVAVYRPPECTAFSGALALANLSVASCLGGALSAERRAYAAQAAAFAPAADAWAKSLPGKAGERRLMWCHSPLGLKGDGDWATSVKTLASFGYTDLIANLVWGGCSAYRSAVATPTRVVEKYGDMLDAALAACRANGVKLHVWNVTWPMSRSVAREHGEALDKAGRLQYDIRGRRVDVNGTDWLCPSSPENRAWVTKIMVELAERGVDGVHFDYIRYPMETGCYCANCRARFEARRGSPCAAWPRDVTSGGACREAWTEFRAANVTALVRDVAERIHAHFPKVEVSAAVFRTPERDGVTIGQDWPNWMKAGYVDFVCPMDYTWNLDEFRRLLANQKQRVGLKGVYPGIGLTSSARFPQDGGDAYRFSEQVLEVRAAGFSGFTCFNFDPRCARAMAIAREGVLSIRSAVGGGR